MRFPKLNSQASPELRVVDGDSNGNGNGNGKHAEPSSDERNHADLVSEVIGEAGLLPADKLEQVRRQAADSSFSQALVDEGFASARRPRRSRR